MGSSASTAAGCVTSARATAVRWRSPPESSPGPVLEPLAQSHALEQLARRALRFLRRRAAHEQRHGHVLDRRELGQQMMKLVDEPEARLRKRPRSTSLKRLIDSPATRTSPAVGSSSPPRSCSSVVLPEPDDPMIASAVAFATLELHAAQHLDFAARRPRRF